MTDQDKKNNEAFSILVQPLKDLKLSQQEHIIVNAVITGVASNFNNFITNDAKSAKEIESLKKELAVVNSELEKLKPKE